MESGAHFSLTPIRIYGDPDPKEGGRWHDHVHCTLSIGYFQQSVADPKARELAAIFILHRFKYLL